MKTRLSAAIVIIVAQTAAAQAQNCLSQSDTGNTKCMAGVLYRCACSQIVGSTICSWNNSATGCSSMSRNETALWTPIVDRIEIDLQNMTTGD